MIEHAIFLALQAHKGQKDKAVQPYILHPLRVMCKMENNKEKIIAVRHDTIEDSDLYLTILKEKGFPKEILKTLDLLTHREGESYIDYIKRVSTRDKGGKKGY